LNQPFLINKPNVKFIINVRKNAIPFGNSSEIIGIIVRVIIKYLILKITLVLIEKKCDIF